MAETEHSSEAGGAGAGGGNGGSAPSAQRERRARELLQHITAVSSRVTDEREALQLSLDLVCAATGWPVGHVYMRADEGEQALLASTDLWHLERSERFAAFRRVTEATRLPSGVGLPGRVLATASPAWVMDVMRDPNFPRAHAADAIGVRAGFAFPVIVVGEVYAVLEFFADVAVEPDEPLLSVMASVGIQLGRVVERRLANAELAESELRFRSVTQSANDAIISTDTGGLILSWNHGAEVIFGYREAEALGQPLELIIPTRFHEQHRNGMARYRATREARVIGRTVELFGVRKGGAEFPLELSLAAWVGRDDCFSAIVRDISERRQAEDRLRAFAEELDRKNAELAAKNEALERSRDEVLRSYQQAQQIFAALAEVLPGAELDGKYRLEEQIGVGGFGVVFRAVHLKLERPVAVKVFRPQGDRMTPEHLVRFRLEGVSACRVQHPNAVQVLDSGVSAGGIPYLVMELLEGRTLADVLQGREPLALDRTLRLCAEVADVLAAAHATGIAHRDVKPDNVYLHRGRDGESVKVLDFGIAKLVGVTGPVDTPRLTGTGQMIGTPAYMSPERLRGEDHDGSADVYSLGVMLYEMVAGRPPFWSWSGNAWEIVRAHLDQTAQPLEELVPEVPAALSALVARCLAKTPIERPSAAYVAAQLRELVVIGGAGAGAGTASSLGRLGDTRALPAPMRFPTPLTVRDVVPVVPRRTPEVTVEDDEEPV